MYLWWWPEIKAMAHMGFSHMNHTSTNHKFCVHGRRTLITPPCPAPSEMPFHHPLLGRTGSAPPYAPAAAATPAVGPSDILQGTSAFSRLSLGDWRSWLQFGATSVGPALSFLVLSISFFGRFVDVALCYLLQQIG